MCGDESQYAFKDPRRYGALAVLNSSAGPLRTESADSNACSSWNVVFFNHEDHKSSTATHVKVTAGGLCSPTSFSDMFINIYSTGDLTVPQEDCSLFQKFPLPMSRSRSVDGRSLEVELPQSLQLEVGGQGIIGRRISMSQRTGANSGDAHLAEGIVGFNSLLSL